MTQPIPQNHRREFLRFLAASPLLAGIALPESVLACTLAQDELAEAKNVFEIRELSARQLTDIALRYCDGGADDLKTVRANSAAFDELQIRARRLVNVSSIDTNIEVFGKRLASPIIACPVGFLQVFHDEGELAAAAPLVADRIASEGLKLYALQPERRDLETIFVEISAREGM